MRVLVTFAAEAEFAPFKRRYPFRLKAASGSRSGKGAFYRCEIKDVQLDVYLTGIGWKGSRESLVSLMRQKPDLCISSGLAGGLRPDLEVGTVVVAREVLLVNGGQRLTSRPLLVQLAEKTGAKAVDTFLTSTSVVCDAKTKQTMAPFGDVVEMESFQVLRIARDAGVPALSIRAISDAADEDLPLDFGQTIGADGQIRYGRLILQAGLRPQTVPAMVRFGRRSQRAALNLTMFLDKYLKDLRQHSAQWGVEGNVEVAAR